MSVDEDVKRVYNTHLATTRLFQRKPFRPRKDFSKFDEEPKSRYYKSLTKWFGKHPEINQQMYFEATLYFRRHDPYVPIEEFCKSIALSNYTQYCKIINSLDLDCKKSYSRCIESYQFIHDYCKLQEIEVKDYIDFVEVKGGVNAFLQHVKNNHVSIYALFAFPDFYDTLKLINRDSEVWNFFLEEEFTPLVYLKRWNKSSKYQTLATKAKKKITNKHK